MKVGHSRLILAVGCVLCVVAVGLAIAADDAVIPQSLALTHLRDEATLPGSAVAFWRGDSLLLTNCVCYNATTNGGAIQGLSNVVVTVKVGSDAASVTYTGTVQSVTGGTYWCLITTVPTNGNVYLQTTLTDAASSNYTYAWKSLTVKTKL